MCALCTLILSFFSQKSNKLLIEFALTTQALIEFCRIGLRQSRIAKNRVGLCIAVTHNPTLFPLTELPSFSAIFSL